MSNSLNHNPQGSSVHGTFQARILDWVPISSSRGSSWPRDLTHTSCVSCIAGRFFTHWAIREAPTLGCCCCSITKSCLTLRNPVIAACQAPLSIVSQSLLKFMSIESVKLSISFSVASFCFCLQSFPVSESFPISWLFASRGQSIEVSASATVFPMNIQGWFPLRWTGLIS